MEKLIIFGLLSIPLIFLSRKSLVNFGNHGFFRFFSWECILWLLVSNIQCWFEDPFGPKQVISWIFLIASIYYVVAGIILIKKIGMPQKSSEREELYGFEKTTELIDNGIFRYIRHPLYGSLILLTWGIFLKNVSFPLLFVALASTVFLYVTALYDEKECIQFFGRQYKEYMKRTKMFVPFLF
jgi:protein-S-isoprenylcysteine O-methyltransferase Ste14